MGSTICFRKRACKERVGGKTKRGKQCLPETPGCLHVEGSGTKEGVAKYVLASLLVVVSDR